MTVDAVRRAVDPVDVADEPDGAGVAGERDVDAEPELRRDRDRGARRLAPEEALEDRSRGGPHPGQLVGLQAGPGEDLVAGPPEHLEPGLGRAVGASTDPLADEDLERLVDGASRRRTGPAGPRPASARRSGRRTAVGSTRRS